MVGKQPSHSYLVRQIMSDIIQTKSIRDQRLAPQQLIYQVGGEDRVLYVYSVVQGRP